MATQLTVYKASAGSGKTFTLAIEYIKLLIRNPHQYRNILAVTFTNKATDEMKERILSQLFGIWKKLDDSSNYMKKVTEELNITPEYASQQAGIALRNLIHNYSYFRVETIDAFFQSVLRNLARELDLTANLRVGLNDKQVEEQAVDTIIEELQQTDEILQWLIRYIEEKMEEDKGWNIIKQIKLFGQTIFKDFYKAESEKLNAFVEKKGAFDEYVRMLKRLKKKAKEQIGSYSQRFIENMNNAGMTVNDLSNKSRGINSYFNKLLSDDFSDKKCMNETLIKHLDSAENWAPKTAKNRSIIINTVETTLLPLLREAEKERPAIWKTYATTSVILKQINQLRLLNSIEKKVHELNEGQNRFLLSNTQTLLHSLIGSSDSPFIFEKISTQLEHVMIDEFQDTSTVQWNNFKVLLQETMSHLHSKNLIVGDVKQSIYRWRSGDWRLLNGIEQEFQKQHSNINIKNLSHNYRSSRRIIEFNNLFFTAAKILEYKKEKEVNASLAVQLLQAYADVVQKVPSDRPEEGYVRVKILSNPDMLEELLTQVDELLEAGIQQKDIAILVRSNKIIPAIASHFMKERGESIRLVSDEAFRLDASIAVNILINALRLLLEPENPLLQAYAQKAYEAINGSDNTPDGYPILWREEEFRSQLLALPLSDMLERIFQLYHLEKMESQNAYICRFYDEVNNFIQDFGSNPSLFLNAWDETIHEKTIQSDETNGIRIISIHKSKGLEFKNVIIPWCDWKLSLGDTLWCHTNVEPFSQLPILPVSYSNKLKDTIFCNDYEIEHLQNCVDNLNLLYVAFTRAKHNLIVLAHKRDTSYRSYLLEQCLPMLNDPNELNDFISKANLPEEEYKRTLDAFPTLLQNDCITFETNDETTSFEYGELTPSSPSKKSPSPNISPAEGAGGTSNVFLIQPIPVNQAICSYETKVTFKQSNKSRDFVQDDEQGDEQQMYIKMGNILHNVFARIHTIDDISQELRKMEFEGLLYDEDVSADKLRNMLTKRLNHLTVSDWFSPRWKLFNECSIITLTEDGKLYERRPDRVMTDGHQTIVVDFKFGRPQKKHFEQVREYIQLLENMSFKDVKGYLWYVYKNQIEQVL